MKDNTRRSEAIGNIISKLNGALQRIYERKILRVWLDRRPPPTDMTQGNLDTRLNVHISMGYRSKDRPPTVECFPYCSLTRVHNLLSLSLAHKLYIFVCNVHLFNCWSLTHHTLWSSRVFSQYIHIDICILYFYLCSGPMRGLLGKQACSRIAITILTTETWSNLKAFSINMCIVSDWSYMRNGKIFLICLVYY